MRLPFAVRGMIQRILNKVVGLASEISRQNVGSANLLSLIRAGGMRYIKKEVLVFNQN